MLNRAQFVDADDGGRDEKLSSELYDCIRSYVDCLDGARRLRCMKNYNDCSLAAMERSRMRKKGSNRRPPPMRPGIIQRTPPPVAPGPSVRPAGHDGIEGENRGGVPRDGKCVAKVTYQI